MLLGATPEIRLHAAGTPGPIAVARARASMNYIDLIGLWFTFTDRGPDYQYIITYRKYVVLTTPTTACKSRKCHKNQYI